MPKEVAYRVKPLTSWLQHNEFRCLEIGE